MIVAFDAVARNFEMLLMMAFDSQTLALRRVGWLAVDLTPQGWQVSHVAEHPEGPLKETDHA